MRTDTHARGVRTGSADPKMVAAVVFCGLGVLWGAYGLVGAFGGGSEQGSSASLEQREIEGAFDEDGNAIDTVYERTNSSGARERVTNAIGVAINEQSASAFGALQGVSVGTPDALSGAVVGTFGAVLGGDGDGFVSALRAMGAQIDEDDSDEGGRFFGHLEEMFRGAQVDVSRVRVSKYVEPDRRPGMRTERREEAEEEGGGSGLSFSERVMEMNPDSMFPDAPGKGDPSAIEVTVPAKVEGEAGETSFGLIMTWNAELGLWQPAAFKVTTRTAMESEGTP